MYDLVGSGNWRLLERVEALRGMPLVIVAARMAAALPGVLAGSVPELGIAAPVSHWLWHCGSGSRRPRCGTGSRQGIEQQR